jgi:hypothetical protein
MDHGRDRTVEEWVFAAALAMTSIVGPDDAVVAVKFTFPSFHAPMAVPWRGEGARQSAAAIERGG